MTEDDVKLRARLVVAEYMIIHLLAVKYRMTKATPEQVTKANDKCLAQIRAMTIPGIDPVWSDLLSAEAEEAARSLLASVESDLGMAKRL